MAAFESIGLPYAYDDKTGIFETEDGIKIGIISVDVIYGGRNVETYVQNGIQKLRQQEADLILACCHWGIESTYNATGYQLELGRKCIDWGVDLVVGCHPHVLQELNIITESTLSTAWGISVSAETGIRRTKIP